MITALLFIPKSLVLSPFLINLPRILVLTDRSGTSYQFALPQTTGEDFGVLVGNCSGAGIEIGGEVMWPPSH